MSSQPAGQVPDPGTAPSPRQSPPEPVAQGHDPHFDDPVLLEDDETVPPRPEEEVADLLRAEPDPSD